MTRTKTYSHGGDLGDLIAGLPALLQHGGGDLVLHPYPPVREPWHPQKVERVAPFLLMQEYVTGVRYSDHPEGTALDEWRRRRVRHGRARPGHPTITDWHTTAARQTPWPHDRAWLKVDEPRREAATVINRTARYQGDPDVMRFAVERYGADAVFLGTEDEHDKFVTEIGYVRRVETPTLLDAARVVAGADLYVGNQSSLLWVAHGLQRPVLVEEWQPDPNCHLVRDGARYGLESFPVETIVDIIHD